MAEKIAQLKQRNQTNDGWDIIDLYTKGSLIKGDIPYTDEGANPDYAGVKYRIVIMNGDPFLEVIES